MFPHILGVTVHQVGILFFGDKPRVLSEFGAQLFAFPAGVSQEEADVAVYLVSLQYVSLYLLKVTVQKQAFADRYGTGDVCQCVKVEQGICSDRPAFV